MKKMMIIAVMIGALLMPAQSFAQNRRMEKGERKVQMENRRGESQKGGLAKKGGKNSDHGKKGMHQQHMDMRHPGGHAHKPVIVHKPAHKPVIVNHCSHAPVPPPPPRPVVVHHHCNDDLANVAAVAIGVAGLISILAN